MGNAEEAIRFASLAATLKPAMPDYYQTMAIAHEAAGQKEKAGEVFNRLGNALQEQCRFAEAIEAYSYSLNLNPGFAGTMINRGSALTRMGRYAEGAADFNAALALLGGQTEITGLLNVANALSGLGRAEEAIAVYTQLLAIDPDHATAHCSRALLKLRLGLMPDAWEEYEWRWSKAGGFREPRGQFRQPMWQGESPGDLGGALLVIAEQGLGDVIQFARYIPLLAGQGYDIIFETLPELTSLFADGFAHPRIRVIGRIDNPLEVEGNLPFAAWTGVMSLPARFHTTLETIPASVPYISVAGEKVEQWREKLNFPLPAGEAVSLSRSGLRETGEGIFSSDNSHPHLLR
jgi:tetratricopeptide (TPR) repeat protein